MKKAIALLAILMALSCNRGSSGKETKIITVSIAPFEYFIREIAGNDFSINIMVPAGANPHIYEPYPDQIARLRKSVAYISNGYLGFEMTWLDRFYEMNKSMKRLSFGDNIVPIVSGHEHDRGHEEGADPHFWVSPECAAAMARAAGDLLCSLEPQQCAKYKASCSALIERINELDKKASSLLSEFSGRPFMIYHPNLAYIARDYGLQEIAVEFEGKEPPPSRLRQLVDIARGNNIKTIFVQREYDSRNAKAIADEIGAEVVVIDPLSGDWMEATSEIIESLHKSFVAGQKK